MRVQFFLRYLSYSYQLFTRYDSYRTNRTLRWPSRYGWTVSKLQKSCPIPYRPYGIWSRFLKQNIFHNFEIRDCTSDRTDNGTDLQTEFRTTIRADKKWLRTSEWPNFRLFSKLKFNNLPFVAFFHSLVWTVRNRTKIWNTYRIKILAKDRSSRNYWFPRHKLFHELCLPCGF